MKTDKEFCQELKRWADAYVGKAEGPMPKGLNISYGITPTDEAYRVYSWKFKERADVYDEWQKLIKSLIDAETKLKREGENVGFIGEIRCCIYWRVEPIIESATEPFPIIFYSRFLISKKRKHRSEPCVII